jgi:7-cyano-7-deazaguanine synthase
MNKEPALVLLSGGQDSATCLLLALEEHTEVECISFYYGQKHEIELQSGEDICELLQLKRSVVDCLVLQDLANSQLFGSFPGTEVFGVDPITKLPSSFVPGRNLLFLTLAAIHAYTRRIHTIYGGMCQTDYSGYPDCRTNTIKALELALNYGLDYLLEIKTPLMNITKAQSILVIKDLPNFKPVMELTHTCYNGMRPPCQTCPACILRAKGFEEANIKDPLLEV